MPTAFSPSYWKESAPTEALLKTLRRLSILSLPFVFEADALRIDPAGGPKLQYMLLINGDESIQPQSEEEHETLFQNFQKFTSDLRSSGAFVMGNPFAPPTSATTVRVRDGKYAVTDGPFAETKEYLGGFLIIEADSLDIALETAKACPGLEYGSVEIRPIVPIV